MPTPHALLRAARSAPVRESRPGTCARRGALRFARRATPNPACRARCTARRGRAGWGRATRLGRARAAASCRVSTTRPVRACADGEAAALNLEVDVTEHSLLAEAPAELLRSDHSKSLGRLDTRVARASVTTVGEREKMEVASELGITAEELQLAARNHAMPLEALWEAITPLT